MKPRTIASYVRELKPDLPAAAFAPARSRLLWLPVHLAVIGLVITALAAHWLPWPLLPIASLVLGVSYAGITFLAHETLHGAVVRGRTLQRVVGWIGFLPFVVSPRLWIAWHNKHHHGHANQQGRDPDLYPTLAEYEASRAARITTDHFALGGKRWTGALSLLFGFTGQSTWILRSAARLGILTPRQHKLAIAETAAGVAVWTALALVIGLVPFVFAFAIPLVVANLMVMAYILTNHGLSPLGEINDPLVNSLSVTVPRWYEWLTLGFGYHTEHHVFPSMSTRHGPLVRDLLRARWPAKYQSMPLGQALRALHATARVYADDTTLVDPRTGRTWPTIGPARIPTIARGATAL